MKEPAQAQPYTVGQVLNNEQNWTNGLDQGMQIRLGLPQFVWQLSHLHIRLCKLDLWLNQNKTTANKTLLATPWFCPLCSDLLSWPNLTASTIPQPYVLHRLGSTSLLHTEIFATYQLLLHHVCAWNVLLKLLILSLVHVLFTFCSVPLWLCCTSDVPSKLIVLHLNHMFPSSSHPSPFVLPQCPQCPTSSLSGSLAVICPQQTESNWEVIEA